MPLRLGPSSKLSVALRDVRPPTKEAAHRLAMLALESETPATVAYSQSDGLPGKLYPHGVLRTVKAQNLSARVVHASDASEQQRKDFDKLTAALEKGKLVRSGLSFPLLWMLMRAFQLGFRSSYSPFRGLMMRAYLFYVLLRTRKPQRRSAFQTTSLGPTTVSCFRLSP